MAKVRPPGEQIKVVAESDENLPEEEQTRFIIKVLDFDEWKTVIRLGEQTTMKNALDMARKILGIGLIGVENLKIERDGKEEEFSLEKSGSEITPQSMSILMPFKDEILLKIREAATLKKEDIKN